MNSQVIQLHRDSTALDEDGLYWQSSGTVYGAESAGLTAEILSQLIVQVGRDVRNLQRRIEALEAEPDEADAAPQESGITLTAGIVRFDSHQLARSFAGTLGSSAQVTHMYMVDDERGPHFLAFADVYDPAAENAFWESLRGFRTARQVEVSGFYGVWDPSIPGDLGNDHEQLI